MQPAGRNTGPSLPARLGRYELLAKIAEGGMATVYLGRLQGPMGFQRPVAIKLMRPEYVQSDDFVKMFLDEARLVARLSHPNVVQLLELGQDESELGHQHGGFFIVMECLMGESLLDTWYACQDRALMLPYDIIAWIGARAAEGLHHAHELRDPMTGASERIVHRDVNPGNVFLTYEGQVKVIDFGVAKALNRLSSTTSFGTLKGKVAYMAPEQAKTADVDRRADVFSLAVTLWELTTDRRLFKRKTDVDTLIAVNQTEVPDPSTAIEGYPVDLWHVLQRALFRDRDTRYPTALDFSRELDRFAQTQGRTVDATTLAEVMNFLFYEQRNRFVQWLKQASAGEQSEVLRSHSQRQLAMASIAEAPMSRRAGSAMPIRGSMPDIAVPKAPNPAFGATMPLSQPSPVPPADPDATRAVSPSQPPPGGGAPRIHMPPNVPPPNIGPMLPYVPMPGQPGAPVTPVPGPPPSQRSGSLASNIIFFIIAALAVLGLGGYFAYVKFGHPKPPPIPSALPSASTSAPPPMEIDSGAPVLATIVEDAATDAPEDTGPPDTGVVVHHTHHDAAAIDPNEVLLHRR